MKERSSRTLTSLPCAVVVGAQRLEGRWIWIRSPVPEPPLLTRFACWASPSTAPYGHCTGCHLELAERPDSLNPRSKGKDHIKSQIKSA